MPVTPSEREEEYFAKMEYENKKKIEDQKQKKLAAGEKKRRKELHHMKVNIKSKKNQIFRQKMT